jgi:hypothetical protein
LPDFQKHFPNDEACKESCSILGCRKNGLTHVLGVNRIGMDGTFMRTRIFGMVIMKCTGFVLQVRMPVPP